MHTLKHNMTGMTSSMTTPMTHLEVKELQKVSINCKVGKQKWFA